MAGYSSTPLVDKLGFKPGMKVIILDAPAGYVIPKDVNKVTFENRSVDLIHIFVKSRAELIKKFPALKVVLAPTGILWISWPKKAAKVATDLDENLIREIGLVGGLVDVKVAAIDEVWSGLKFVYRLKDRH